MERRLAGSAGIGFGAAASRGAGREDAAVECLVELGMIPELANRLSGILLLPDPTAETLRRILTCILSEANRLLRRRRSQIELAADAAALVVSYALETKSFSRGMRGVVWRLLDQMILNNEHACVVRFSRRSVARIIEEMGRGEAGRRVLGRPAEAEPEAETRGEMPAPMSV